MEYLSYIIVAGLAFYLGWVLRAVVIIRKLVVDPEATIELLEQLRAIDARSLDTLKGDDQATELKIERVGNELYGYVKDTDQFVGQAKSLTELLELAHKRHPDRKFFGTIEATSPAKELAH